MPKAEFEGGLSLVCSHASGHCSNHRHPLVSCQIKSVTPLCPLPTLHIAKSAILINMADAVTCPICGYTSNGEYAAHAVQLHVEEHHTDDSPFTVNGATADPPRNAATTTNGSSNEIETSEENPWVKCTRQGCGEYVLISDIDYHLELHEATAASQEEDQKSSGRQTPASSNDDLPMGSRQSSTSSNGHSRREERRTRPSSNEYVPREGHQTALSSYVYRDTVVKDPPPSPQKQQRSRPTSSNYSQRGRGILEYFSGTSQHGPPPKPPPRRQVREPLKPGRLGIRELGPHAFEKTMPASVRHRLLHDAEPCQVQRISRDGRLYRETIIENETGGLIPVLAELCTLFKSTVVTYFCHPSVRHVEKIRCDGNFCGYWNIQMLLSYIHEQDARRNNSRPRPLPNVLQIQNSIEEAWDAGICSYGRIETDGVRGTRKWIGTHEALAFFTRNEVEVEALSFKQEKPPSVSNGASSSSSSQPAVIQLLDHVEAYFISGVESTRQHGNSYITALPPIYFQRFGHSMTIVGLERKADGSRNLLVFDPSFETTPGMDKLLAGRDARAHPETLLRSYRRSDVSLSRWEEFEVIV